MFKKDFLTKSINMALFVGVTSSSIIVNSAYAEEVGSNAEQEVERISVTGSRIRRPGAVSASPIVSMDSAEIEMLQTPQVEEVLRTLPSTIPGDGAGVNNGSAGAATVNLRALGTDRTLVLMDGRRMIPFNINGIVDTATVPVSLIDRIDVVTGGASAVYGSDAIAGAVNFVMKDNFEGVDFLYNHSETGEGDGEQDSMSLTLGSSLDDGRGNVALAMSWTDRKPVMQGDRPLGRLGIATNSGGGYQNFLDGKAAVPPHDNCGGPDVTTVESGGGSTTSIPTRYALLGGVDADGQFREDGTLGSGCSRFNYSPYNYYQTPQERYSATAIAHYDIAEEHTVYTTATFSNTSVVQQIAPSGTFGAAFNLPLRNPLIGDQAREWMITTANQNVENGIISDGNNWTDVNGNGIVDEQDYLNVQLRRRTLEMGPRSTEFKSSQFQLVAGIEGLINDDWGYDISYQYGESNRTNTQRGYTHLDRIQNALDTFDGVTCNGGDAGCVPINLFGGFGTITPEMAEYSSALALNHQTYSQEVITASVNGPINFIEIPTSGEPLSISAGYEHRSERGQTTPDLCLMKQPGSCLGGNGGNTLPVEGGFNVSEFFIEGVLPVFDGQAMAERLDIEFAYRAADYDSVGSNNTWKFGISWRPVEDVLVRVMQQSATRAPNVGEIASPLVSGLDNATLDPCSVANADNIDATLKATCISTGMLEAQVGKVQDLISGQVNSFTGSNPNQLPDAEEATTFTAGLVYTNEDFYDFSISIDYYDIEVDNTIGTYTSQQTLDACYTANIASECAKIIRRGGSLAIDGAGVQAYTTNLSYRKAEGVELGVDFKVGLDELGELSFSTNLNHYLTNERRSSSILPVIDCMGIFSPGCSPTPQTSWNQRITWDMDDVSVSMLWRHISGTEMTEARAAAAFEAFRSIDAYDYVDLFGSYALNDYTSFTFGVDNVFEKEPPVVGGEAGSTAFNSGNTFPSTYNAIGRVFRAGVKLSF